MLRLAATRSGAPFPSAPLRVAANGRLTDTLMAAGTYIVGRAEAGRTVTDWLCARLGLATTDVHRLLRGRCVTVGGAPCSDPSHRLRAGQRLVVRPSLRRPQRETCEEQDSRSKPRRAGGFIPPGQARRLARPSARRCFRRPARRRRGQTAGTDDHAPRRRGGRVRARARRFLPPTLADLLPGLLAKGKHGPPGRVRAVHRLDSDTSGLVVFARTAEAERELGRQFRAHSTDRLYLALVRGRAKDGRIESVLVRDRGDGRRGSASAPDPTLPQPRGGQVGASGRHPCPHRGEPRRLHAGRVPIGDRAHPSSPHSPRRGRDAAVRRAGLRPAPARPTDVGRQRGAAHGPARRDARLRPPGDRRAYTLDGAAAVRHAGPAPETEAPGRPLIPAAPAATVACASLLPRTRP